MSLNILFWTYYSFQFEVGNFDYIVKTTIIICHLYFFYNFVLDDSERSSKQKRLYNFLRKSKT